MASASEKKEETKYQLTLSITFNELPIGQAGKIIA